MRSSESKIFHFLHFYSPSPSSVLSCLVVVVVAVLLVETKSHRGPICTLYEQIELKFSLKISINGGRRFGDGKAPGNENGSGRMRN